MLAHAMGAIPRANEVIKQQSTKAEHLILSQFKAHDLLPKHGILELCFASLSDLRTFSTTRRPDGHVRGL